MTKRDKLTVKNTKVKSGDFILVIMTLALVIFGIIMVFSASYYYAMNKFGNPYHYLLRDIVWAVSGLVGMLICAALPYRFYYYVAPIAMGIMVLLLILVFSPLGVTRNNATRWIGVGPITFMPGEFTKIAVILFVAWFFSKKPERINSFTEGILPMVVLMGICGGLIIKQPNLSTAITVCGIIVLMMFVAGMSWWYLGALAGIGAMGVLGIVFLAPESEWMKRITSFLDPFADTLGEGYQVVQGLMAMGTGGLFGSGLGKSVQKNLYLPEPQNDFILSIIGEELGFIGIMLLMIAYLILIWRGIHIAANAKDLFGTLVAAGISIMVSLQVIMNIAVVTSSMPPTGVTLPFISYGGNALWLFMGSMGILLNISRHSVK